MIRQLVINDASHLLFGRAPRPVDSRRGFQIGAGAVYPEVNFTLPSMELAESTWQAVRRQYEEMIEGVCRRAVELKAPAIVIEFEHLPPMTENPEWGAELTALLRATLDRYRESAGLCGALRVTPVDIRVPPHMRTGPQVETLLRSFDLCAQAGADFLSIESTGGKEIHDEGLMYGDLAKIVFALAVLGARDMRFLWGGIGRIARERGVISAGDTACGFANTAMVLADRGMLPRTLACVDRVATVIRTLEAHHAGAIGPTKDCGYEGPFLKAMTGVPISLEGKSSACAHLSHIGNVTSACCDLWSNESVQNVRLLSGPAPVVSLEQLVYDCRLMNRALEEGGSAALRLRDWLVESDSPLDPQAYILRPDFVIEASRAMIAGATPLDQILRGVEFTLDALEAAASAGRTPLDERERKQLDFYRMELEALPREEEALIALALDSLEPGKVIPGEYGFEAPGD